MSRSRAARRSSAPSTPSCARARRASSRRSASEARAARRRAATEDATTRNPTIRDRKAPLALTLLALAAALLGGCAPERTAAAVQAGPAAAAERRATGWIAWESNRSGAFRIWIRPLAGGEPRRLSPDEPGRDHCCAHLSPDGERLVYLSLPGGAREYLPPTADGELHLVRTDGRGDRVVVRPARAYGEHRAAVWWSAGELVYLAGDGTTRKLDLAAGRDEVVARGPRDGQGWLVDPTGRWASGGTPTFSERLPSGEIRLSTPLGGCQPYFTADGELGIWAAGAGGPIDVIDLETRATRTILRKDDPRLPAPWRYLYFPMVSRDRTLLAWAASAGEHHHFRADYEVFVAEVDAATLEPVGEPQRVTRDPGVDRFPDVWRLASARPVRRPPPSAATASAEAAAESAPPVFLWRTAEAPNRRRPDAPSEVLELEGAAWTDRLGRLALAGGAFTAPEARAREVDAELRATNVLTLALLVEPRSIAAGAGGPVAALALSEKDRGFLLRQDGARLGFVLRRANAHGRLGGPGWTIAELPDARPHHVAIRFSPGRIAAFLDGRPVFHDVAPGDFFHWRNRRLGFGADLASDERFRGFLSEIAIWSRELADAEIAREAERALAAAGSSRPPERLELEARLTARSVVPTLEEISPYRSALVVEEYEPLRATGGAAPGGRLRVARWAILDGERLPALARPIGSTARLRLEPYDAQPQLESVVLSDTLPPLPEAGRARLQFEVGLADG